MTDTTTANESIKKDLVSNICYEINEIFVRRATALGEVFRSEVIGIHNVLINFIAIFIQESSINDKQFENLEALFNNIKECLSLYDSKPK